MRFLHPFLNPAAFRAAFAWVALVGVVGAQGACSATNGQTTITPPPCTDETGQPCFDNANRDTGVTLAVRREVLQASLEPDGLNVKITLQKRAEGVLPVEVTMRLADLEGAGLGAGRAELNLSGMAETPVLVKLNTPRRLSDEELAAAVVEWQIRAPSETLNGRKGLFGLIPERQTVLLGNDALVVGGKTQYRLLVTNPIDGKPAKGAAVALFLEKPADAPEGQSPDPALPPVRRSAGSFTVGDAGMEVLEVTVPEDFDATALAADITHPDGRVQTVRARVSVRREERLLVTTDKPMYQPGQTMHLRVLALRSPDLRPRADAAVVFEVQDGKGNKVFRKEATTDSFGIAATEFVLATQVNEGAYKIAVAMGPSKAEKTVTVERYVLPKFKATVNMDRAYYKPGQTLQGTVSAQYLFGRPVAGGTVLVQGLRFDVQHNVFAQVNGVTDDSGMFSFSLPIPSWVAGGGLDQQGASLLLKVTVLDTAEQKIEVARPITVAQGDLNVTVVPESGSLVAGVENRLWIITSDPLGNPLPARGSITIQGGTQLPPMAFDTAPDGLGFVAFTPYANGYFSAYVSARTDSGQNVEQYVQLSDEGRGAQGFVLVRPDKALYAVGDAAKIRILVAGSQAQGSELPDRVYLDVIRQGQTRLMTTVELNAQGEGEAELGITPDLGGAIELFAYYLKASGEIVRDSRRVVVALDNGLSVRISGDKSEYKPREEAKIRLAVTDAAGNGVPAAVGLQIVDEAVFALQEFRPGLEKVFFLLEQQLQSPKYQVHGYGFDDLVTPAPGEDTPDGAEARDRRAQVVTAKASTDRAYGVSIDTRRDARAALVNRGRAAVTGIVERKLLPYLTRLFDDGTLTDVASFNQFCAKARNSGLWPDPWGTPMVVYATNYGQIEFISAGPDEKTAADPLNVTPSEQQAQADDIRVSKQVWSLNSDKMKQGLGGGRGGWGWEGDGDFAGGPPQAGGQDPNMGPVPGANEANRDDSATSGGGENVTVRNYFPETLYVNPAIVTDGYGNAEITVPMADSITSWRATGMANSQSGLVGSGLGNITVFQPFFIDTDFPVQLTRNDEVAAPVVLYNYLDTPQTVQLRVDTSAERGTWFTLLDSATRSVTLQPGQVKAERFRIRANKVGVHAFRVYGIGDTLSDAVERLVRVAPNGREKVENVSAKLAESANHDFHFPETAIEGANSLLVKVYPGLLAQVVEGLDSIFQQPYGCFEQTSSTTYPNVLLLNYMLKTGQINPEIELKARNYINLGYQRLLSYEVQGGGFEWFGNTPAHPILTAYGLMEFVDMAKVHPVDPAVISRTANWLAGLQQSDGSFRPASGGIAEGAINNFQTSVLRNTAYIGWALVQAGLTTGAPLQARTYVKAHLREEADMYTKGLIANFLIALDRADAEGLALLDELAAQAIVADGKAYWRSGATTEFYGNGDSADVEASAQIAHAMIAAGRHPALVNQVIAWLIGKKDMFGNFSSTQATIQTLRTMVRSLESATESAAGTVTVKLNGAAVGTHTVHAGNADLLWQLDLSDQATSGAHAVTVEFDGTGGLMYQIVARYWLEGSTAGAGEGPLVVKVEYDRTTLEIDDTAEVTVTVTNRSGATVNMALVDLGVPPGFDVLPASLEDDVAAARIQKFELTARQVILYVAKVTPQAPFVLKYQVKARMPMRGESGPSAVYPYYEPDRRTQSGSTSLEVTGE